MPEYPVKQAVFIDADLFSGSTDTFRTAFGGYFEVVEGEADAVTGETATEIELMYPETLQLAGEMPWEALSMVAGVGPTEEDTTDIADEDVLLKNGRVPCRVSSDNANELIKGDVQWKAIWLGGEYADVTYPGIYNENVHSYFYAPYEFPYSKITANSLDGDEDQDDVESTIEISYDYSIYLPGYQEHIDALDSELLIPSYYILFDLANRDYNLYPEADEDTASSGVELYSEELKNYITIESSSYISIPDMFSFNEATIPGGAPTDGSEADVSDEFQEKNSYLVTEFLTSSYVQNMISSSTQTWAEDRLQNLLFNESAVEEIADQSGMFTTYADMLPYKMKISFNEYEGSDGAFVTSTEIGTKNFATSIRNHDFSSKFIKTLYQAFDGKITDLTPNAAQYVTNLQYSSASYESDGVTYDTEYTISEATNTPYREIDYTKFLSYCYNNYLSSDAGCLLVGPSTLATLSATDSDGTYRHFNTSASLGVLSDMIDFLDIDTSDMVSALREYPVWSTYGTTENTLFGPSNPNSYIEPLAYRVEKVKTDAPSSALQNFWFFKPDPADLDEVAGTTFTFYDNQVKYDVDYTYKVYTYAAVVGFRYKFEDLALTRNIGCDQTAEELYGLEFYDPYSDDEDTTARLYTGDDDESQLVSEYEGLEYDYEADPEVYSTIEETYESEEEYTTVLDEIMEYEAAWESYYDTSIFTITMSETPDGDPDDWKGTFTLTVTGPARAEVAGSSVATEAHIFSPDPYAADFHLIYEPTVKIIEIPLYEKTLRVLDNPANKLTVTPYQVKDNSQRIGFDFVYGSFVEALLPTVISDDDATYEENYAHGKDMLPISLIAEPSVALQRYVEVYRLSTRPTAITDFDGAKIAEIDLAFEDMSQYSYKNAFFDDTIKTNQKYYYLFRILNQQRVLSHLTEITEAELINDGGYKYAVFNTLYEYELEQEVFDTPSVTFKKLIQLQPNLEQLQFNTDNLDYNDSALSQIDNLTIGESDDSIWDKTFKVRLTSKKTGKKIDLNITYTLNSD